MTTLKEKHAYLSTACHHGEHGKCRVSCKYCPATCWCQCHKLTPKPPFTRSEKAMFVMCGLLVVIVILLLFAIPLLIR